MLSDEEKAVLKTAKENYGLTSAEQKILVNLIEKQSKEIEELKEIYQTGYVNGCVSKVYEINKKWKDKIKAKIEELDYNDIGNFERRCKQEVLQSLLEKE